MKQFWNNTGHKLAEQAGLNMIQFYTQYCPAPLVLMGFIMYQDSDIILPCWNLAAGTRLRISGRWGCRNVLAALYGQIWADLWANQGWGQDCWSSFWSPGWMRRPESESGVLESEKWIIFYTCTCTWKTGVLIFPSPSARREKRNYDTIPTLGCHSDFQL